MRQRNKTTPSRQTFNELGAPRTALKAGTKSAMYSSDHPLTAPRRPIMAWQTPAFEDIRFGFEVTMYINNR